MSTVTKVIHRFVRARSDYMLGGELYTQIIPANTQVYSYELVEDGDPQNPDDYRLYYVLGTGGSTYLEIANGEGVDEEGNPLPELSREVLITSKSQLDAIIDGIIQLNCVTYENVDNHKTVNLGENNTITVMVDDVAYEIFGSSNNHVFIGHEDLPLNLQSEDGIVTINSTETVATREFVDNTYLSKQEAETDYADKDYVNYAIQNLSAAYITYDVDGNPFPTKADLDNATVWYKRGTGAIPAVNDYTIVLADEEHEESGVAPATRYICVEVTNNIPVWNFQFTLNSSNFSQAQWDALNSGITADYITGDGTNVPSITKNASDINDLQEDVANLDLHTRDTDNPHQVTKEQVGLGNVDNTSDLDKPISRATQTAINLVTGTVTAHTRNSSIHVTSEQKQIWDNKQDELDKDQMEAVNSGITAEKLEELEAKQDALKMGNHINISNDVISVLDDLSTYDNSTTQFVNRYTNNLVNYYNKSQLGGVYKYQGEVATFNDLPTGNTRLSDDYLELEYITADNLQYIDTGYKANNHTKVVASFKLIDGLDNCIYSTAWSEGNKIRFGANYSTNRATFIYGTQSYSMDTDWGNTKHTVMQDNTKLKVDNVTLSTYSDIPHFSLDSTLFLFKGNDANVRILVTSIYDFAVYEDDTIVLNYIPAYNKVIRAAGMYDLVTNTFHTSMSGTDFVIGERKSTLQEGLVYKVLDENTFYTWYNNNWVNIGQIYKPGDGIAIDPDGTIHISSGSVITTDDVTIIKQPNSSNITAIGLQTKSNDIMYDWIGTKQEWEAGRANHTIADDWICWITDDDNEVDAGVANLAQVASTGNYYDLINRPLNLPDLPLPEKNTNNLILRWNYVNQQLEWIVES